MTKTIKFDLEFTEDGVIGLTPNGVYFIIESQNHRFWTQKGLYDEAIRQELHVRFSTAKVRDKLSRVAG